jgi:hypothetical protein
MSALGAQISNILSPIDMHALPQATQKVMLPVRQQIIDARLDVRDYELADTRVEQQVLARTAKGRLETLQASILTASSHGIFGAADVAELSARIQQIISKLD